MARRSSDREAIEAEIDRVRSLGLDELRTLWRTTFRSSPPPAFTKDLIARFICWHIQEQALGGLDPETAKLLDRLARGDKPERIAQGASSPAPSWCANTRASGTPSPSCRTATCGTRRPTQASPSSRGPSPARPGTAHASLGCVLAAIVQRSSRWQAESHAGIADANWSRRHGGSVSRSRTRGATMKPTERKVFRCAIYTRKSTEHNLDLEFNSLDAQREACEAYIKSQAHEGWRLVPDRYDDGGLLRRLARPPCPADAAGRCRGRQDRHRRGLQGRPAHPLARRLRQAGRAVRPAWGVVRLGHPVVQHHHQHGTADPQRAAVLRPVRARGDRRAGARQDRRLQAQGHLGRRTGPARLSRASTRSSSSCPRRPRPSAPSSRAISSLARWAL